MGTERLLSLKRFAPRLGGGPSRRRPRAPARPTRTMCSETDRPVSSYGRRFANPNPPKKESARRSLPELQMVLMIRVRANCEHHLVQARTLSRRYLLLGGQANPGLPPTTARSCSQRFAARSWPRLLELLLRLASGQLDFPQVFLDALLSTRSAHAWLTFRATRPYRRAQSADSRERP